MQTPLISIVTPSYNQAEYLEETILSVRGQNYSNLEHIIIDGGSTDATLDVLRKYQNTYNLRWISEPDNGQSDALNKGFRMSNGSIIGWINSDDTYMPGAVAKAIDLLNSQQDVGWIYGDGYWTDSDGKVLYKYQAKAFDYKDLIANGMYFPQPSLFFRKDLLDIIGVLDENIHTAMDFDFCLRLGLQAKAGYVPSILATRRLHAQAKSIKSITNFYKDTLLALDKLFISPSLPSDIQQIKGQAYSKCYLVGGYHNFEAGQYREARRLLWLALKNNPRPFRKDFYTAIILILESWLKIMLIHPGHSRRLAIENFQRKFGNVNTCWKDEKDKKQ